MILLKILPILLIVVAIAIALHQYVCYGMWFQLEDIHHETFMIMFAFCGIVLLVIRKGK